MNRIIQGDCLESMKTLEDNSVDAIVTDPPYGLSFMGKKWDYEVPSVEIWKEALRVLKPGGYLLSFAGTRTQHRMACNIEDAGFEIRDMIAWIYGSGFPKSLNIGKAVDKIGGRCLGEEIGNIIKKRRIELGYSTIKLAEIGGFYGNTNHGGTVSNWETGRGSITPEQFNKLIEILGLENEPIVANQRELLSIDKNWGEKGGVPVSGYGEFEVTKGTSEWEGWGTALKPAVEPISVCQKPLQVEHIFAILIDEIWKYLPATDVTISLRDTQAKLDEVVNSVPENARTNFLERINNVALASLFTMSAKTNSIEEKESSAQENVKPNGNEDTREIKTQTGEVEDASLMNISISAQMGDISENTVLLWKNISEELLNQANKLTTSMAIRQITELKTLRSCLSQNIGTNTSLSKEIQPNLEPITVARKPLSEKTVAENVLKWGTGGINIDGSRVGTEEITTNGKGKQDGNTPIVPQSPDFIGETHTGRFPANLIHDGSDEVVSLFPNSVSGGSATRKPRQEGQTYSTGKERIITPRHDSGSASRFFYCAKSSKSERNRGCEGLEEKTKVFNGQSGEPSDEMKGVEEKFTTQPQKNFHPTVKPIALMEYLVKLVSKEGALILDPFAGSGSTLIACKKLKRNYIGCELDPEYIKIAEARLKDKQDTLL